MKSLTKILLSVALVLFVLSGIVYETIDKAPQVFGNGLANTAPLFYVSSSTVFTLTTTSQRLLPTSTPTHRIATTIQPLGCGSASTVFLNMQRDAPATSSTGPVVYASTTMEFKDYPNLPIVQGAVQGITNTGTCSVYVTEWRLIQ